MKKSFGLLLIALLLVLSACGTSTKQSSDTTTNSEKKKAVWNNIDNKAVAEINMTPITSRAISRSGVEGPPKDSIQNAEHR